MAEKIVAISPRPATLKRRLRRHLYSLGFGRAADGSLELQGEGKDVIRSLHNIQRNHRIGASKAFIQENYHELIDYFASGNEVVPERITPVLQRISAGTWESDLFRMAYLTWAVPVSNGFGRRLRYLVWDANNDKLIGLIAIGDPVFNLSVRDNLIGWNAKERGERLVNILDAYVLGAVPPYNMLLGGKLVSALIRSRDVYDDFSRTYGGTAGIISGRESQVSVDDPNVKGTRVFAAPPGFIMRTSGTAFLIGISADEVSPLPPALASRIQYQSFTRTITPAPTAPIPLRDLLGETGMLELPERVWLRAPKEDTPASFRDAMFARLAGRGASGAIDDLEILDTATSVTFYRKRWSKPKRQTGIFVARRPQAYGAPIWCVARLIDGQPRQILDLPLQDKQAAQWRGCDAAWYLQMAIDHCNGTPQKFRRRTASGGAILDFFSPLPVWARRRLMVIGRPEPRDRSLFSYFVAHRELAAEEEFLQRRLWLTPEQQTS